MPMVHRRDEVNCLFLYASSCQRKTDTSYNTSSWPRGYDTVLGKQGIGTIVNLVERKSRFHLMIYVHNKTANMVADAIISMFIRLLSTMEPRFFNTSGCPQSWWYRSILPTPIVHESAAKMRTVMACCGSMCPKIIIWDWWQRRYFQESKKGLTQSSVNVWSSDNLRSFLRNCSKIPDF